MKNVKIESNILYLKANPKETNNIQGP